MQNYKNQYVIKWNLLWGVIGGSALDRLLKNSSTKQTYHGFGRQGTHYKKGSRTQVKSKSSCLFDERVKSIHLLFIPHLFGRRCH
jgi:hypothetical protein